MVVVCYSERAWSYNGTVAVWTELSRVKASNRTEKDVRVRVDAMETTQAIKMETMVVDVRRRLLEWV